MEPNTDPKPAPLTEMQLKQQINITQRLRDDAAHRGNDAQRWYYQDKLYDLMMELYYLTYLYDVGL